MLFKKIEKFALQVSIPRKCKILTNLTTFKNKVKYLLFYKRSEVEGSVSKVKLQNCGEEDEDNFLSCIVYKTYTFKKNSGKITIFW